MQTCLEPIDIAATTLRLKRLSQTATNRTMVATRPLSFGRLMDYSISTMERMARSVESEQALIVGRIYESVKSYHQWEKAHSNVMQRVAQQRRVAAQSHELLAASFELIHRKSLFAHLRSQKIRGWEREALVKHFWPTQSVTRGLVNEHGVFLRSSASQLCSINLGTQLLYDAVFQAPLQDYEKLYAAYFDAYCEWALAQADPQRAHMAQSMVYSLKCDIGVLRRTIAALANKFSTADAYYFDDDAND